MSINTFFSLLTLMHQWYYNAEAPAFYYFMLPKIFFEMCIKLTMYK